MAAPTATVRGVLDGRALAQRRALAAAEVATVGDPVDDALELWSLNPELFDAPPDPVRVREVERVRAMWRRLRARRHGQR